MIKKVTQSKRNLENLNERWVRSSFLLGGAAQSTQKNGMWAREGGNIEVTRNKPKRDISVKSS
jgi:hypothetical protein